LKLEGTFPLSMTGVLSSLLRPLAVARVPVFVISTYETDYVLVKEEDAERANSVLIREGHITFSRIAASRKM